MKLLEIEIKNLKSITHARLVFSADDHRQVSLLYGDNGAGKTTVLEAISLLGHVSTMTRICAGGTGPIAPKQSRFRDFKDEECRTNVHAERIAESERERYKSGVFVAQCEAIEKIGLNEWWRKGTSTGGDLYRPAHIRYRVLFKNDEIEFYISFLQGHDLSITEALSRDQNGPGQVIHDGNMDNWFAVVYSIATRDNVEALIEHMRSVSPHSYWNSASVPEDSVYHTDPRSLARPQAQSIVGYWNTDLNDFGRKNDLRESVKKIRIDFSEQMITRLGLSLPYDSAGTRRHYAMTKTETIDVAKLAAVNESLRVALVDHAIAMRGSSRREEILRSTT
jgi:hypothetical protein